MRADNWWALQRLNVRNAGADWNWSTTFLCRCSPGCVIARMLRSRKSPGTRWLAPCAEPFRLQTKPAQRLQRMCVPRPRVCRDSTPRRYTVRADVGLCRRVLRTLDRSALPRTRKQGEGGQPVLSGIVSGDVRTRCSFMLVCRFAQDVTKLIAIGNP